MLKVVICISQCSLAVNVIRVVIREHRVARSTSRPEYIAVAEAAVLILTRAEEVHMPWT